MKRKNEEEKEEDQGVLKVCAKKSFHGLYKLIVWSLARSANALAMLKQ